MAITKKIQQISPYIGSKIKSSDVFAVASLTSVTGYATYSVSGIQIINYVIDTFASTPLTVPSISCTNIKTVNLSSNNSNITNLTSIYINSSSVNTINLTSLSLSSTTISAHQITAGSLSSISLSANTINTISLSSVSFSAQNAFVNNITSSNVYSSSISSSNIIADSALINGLEAVSKISFSLNHLGSPTETIYILPNLFNSLDVMIQVYSVDLDGDAFKTDYVLVNTENTGDQIILTILYPSNTDFKVIMMG
jgi:hypothetical protein